MKNIINTFIRPYFAFAASVCSIVGLIIVVLSDKEATLIALVTLCLSITLILVGILLAINKMIHQNYEKEYKGISSFYVYETDDGEKSTFETYRLIQCKRMFLSQIEYRFKWSGSYCKLESPIDIMQFRVLLAYKSQNCADKAIFERKLISQEIDTDFEYIESVPFNGLYKQYYHVVVDPSPGYIYRLRWEK